MLKLLEISLISLFGGYLQTELMLFGLLSLLMGHWIAFVAKICVKSSSVMNSQFYPCALEGDLQTVKRILVSGSNNLNHSIVREQVKAGGHNYCPEVVSSLSI